MSQQQLKAVATDKPTNPVAQFKTFMESRKADLQMALPKHITADRMIRLATTEFAKNPMLQKCTAVSVFSCIIQSAQLGLEIGVLGQSYLVPFRNNKNNTYEAQFIPGYKGLIALARRSGEVTSIETHIVYENDKFDLKLGIETHVTHEPLLDGPRGKPRLVYGVAKFRDGGHHFEWMSMGDIERIRARSKASGNGPWVTDYEQMVRKTLIRRMANYLPMSIELAAAISLDNAVAEGNRATIDGDFMVMQQEQEPSMEKEKPEVDAQDEALRQVEQQSAEKDKPAKASRTATTAAPAVTYADVEAALRSAKDADALDAAATLIGEIADADAREVLVALYRQLKEGEA